MTRKKKAPELVDGAIRHLRSMRQHRNRDEREIELLALQRVYMQLSGEEFEAVDIDTSGASWVDQMMVPAGMPLFRDALLEGEHPPFPSLVHGGAAEDAGSLPDRLFDIHALRDQKGLRGYFLDANWTAV